MKGPGHPPDARMFNEKFTHVCRLLGIPVRYKFKPSSIFDNEKIRANFDDVIVELERRAR